MIEAMWLLVIGLIIVGAAYWKKLGAFKNFGYIIGIGAVLIAVAYPGYGMWDAELGFAPDVEADILDVQITAGNWGNLTEVVNDDEDGITVQLAGAGTYGFTNTAGSVNFSFSAGTPPAGATTEDIVTVAFEFDEDATYNGDEIFTQTDDEPDVTWRLNGVSTETDGIGTFTMTYADTVWAELRFVLDETGVDTFGDHLDDVGEKHTMDVTFTSGDWVETFEIEFLVIS